MSEPTSESVDGHDDPRDPVRRRDSSADGQSHIAPGPSPNTATGTTTEQPGRRATIRLLNYWMSLRRLEGLAAFSDFDPRRNPVPWKNCFLIYVDPCNGNAKFELIGQRLLIGLNGTSSNLDPRALPPSFLGEMTQGLDDVLASGRPLQGESIYHARARLAILYRSVLLPFADLRRRPAYLLGAATYRSAVVPPDTATELRR